MTSERDLITAPRPPRLVVIGVAASLAVVVFIVVVSIAFLVRGAAGEIAFGLLPILLILDTSLVGGLLATRRPDNVIGALLLVTSLLSAFSSCSSSAEGGWAATTSTVLEFAMAEVFASRTRSADPVRAETKLAPLAVDVQATYLKIDLTR